MDCIMQWNVTEAFETPHHPLSHALPVFHRHSSTVQIHSSLSNWDWKQRRCLLWSALSHQDASRRLMSHSIFLCHHSGSAEMIAETPLVLLPFRCSVRTEGRGNDADTARVHLHHLPKLCCNTIPLFNQLDWKQLILPIFTESSRKLEAMMGHEKRKCYIKKALSPLFSPLSCFTLHTENLMQLCSAKKTQEINLTCKRDTCVRCQGKERVGKIFTVLHSLLENVKCEKSHLYVKTHENQPRHL